MMQWFQENWLWIAFAIGAFLMMSRMGGCGMGSMGRRRARPGGPGSDDDAPATFFDPVSRHPLSAARNLVSTIYRGRAYYCENRADRDAFEAEPDKYLAEAPDAGVPISSSQRRHHGC